MIRREDARMTCCRPIALIAALRILGMSATPDAMAQQATVEGHARAEEGGAPVQFAITNADGQYRFVGVAPGCSRVQLRRIGFRPLLSDPVQAAA
jgi:hypothetical protein